MATGILRIQAFAARQSSPVEGVTVNVSGDGFTATRLTDAEGNAADVTLTTPACALSLDENNTTQAPYAVCSLVASKPGYRTVRIQGVQVFPGQVTLAQPEMIPDTEEIRDPLNAPIIIPPHSLFTGNGGSGPTPALACVPRVLDRVIIPKNITVTFNGTTWVEGVNYTYNETTGEFASIGGQITVPAAAFTRDTTTGALIVNPGVSTLTVTGTI